MDLMQNIENIREKEGKTETDIAKLLDINKSTYSNYKRYDSVLPIKHINAISNYFNISFDYLFSLTNIKKYEIKKNTIDRKIVGQKLKEFRENNDLTQKQLADILKTSQSTISAYEKGETLILTTFLYAICKKYNISADYLLGRTNSPKYLK